MYLKCYKYNECSYIYMSFTTTYLSFHSISDMINNTELIQRISVQCIRLLHARAYLVLPAESLIHLYTYKNPVQTQIKA